MAVPKRRMSRSNTRSRRAQWKATAPTLVTCANRACRATKPPHIGLPDVRHLQRPPGRQPGLTAPGTMAERGPQGPVTDRGPLLACAGCRARRGAADPRADPPVLRVRERRAADQRAPGVPRRLGAGRDRHRAALPRPPGPARRGSWRSCGRAWSTCTRSRAWPARSAAGRARRAPLPRARRGADRRPHQAQHPRRRHRGADRRGVPASTAWRPRARSCTGSSTRCCSAAPLLGAGLDWKTSLQELTAASDLGVPEYRITEEGPDHSKLFTATAVVGGRAAGLGRRPHQEGGRAEGRPARVARP